MVWNLKTISEEFKGGQKVHMIFTSVFHFQHAVCNTWMCHVSSLRFNCGTGAAQIVSESRIVVGQWHTVTVFRDGMSGWLRMDNDTPISGRSQVTTTRVCCAGDKIEVSNTTHYRWSLSLCVSVYIIPLQVMYIVFCSLLQGQYTKITFRSPLYVGGSPSAYWLVRATGANRGFIGCIQSLTINNKATDIRPWPLGRALSGADIGEEA